MIIKCRLVIKHYLFIKTIFKICIPPIVLVRLRLSLGLKIDLLHTLGLAPARILRSYSTLAAPTNPQSSNPFYTFQI